MSFAGWLMYGDRGPIIGKWPAESLRAPESLGPGDIVLIDGSSGLIRKANVGRGEVGVRLPDDSYISGPVITVPAWWWWLHFRELLASDAPEPEPVKSIVPCWRGTLCDWPTCREDCDGRPGR